MTMNISKICAALSACVLSASAFAMNTYVPKYAELAITINGDTQTNGTTITSANLWSGSIPICSPAVEWTFGDGTAKRYFFAGFSASYSNGEMVWSLCIISPPWEGRPEIYVELTQQQRSITRDGVQTLYTRGGDDTISVTVNLQGHWNLALTNGTDANASIGVNPVTSAMEDMDAIMLANMSTTMNLDSYLYIYDLDNQVDRGWNENMWLHGRCLIMASRHGGYYRPWPMYNDMRGDGEHILRGRAGNVLYQWTIIDPEQVKLWTEWLFDQDSYGSDDKAKINGNVVCDGHSTLHVIPYCVGQNGNWTWDDETRTWTIYFTMSIQVGEGKPGGACDFRCWWDYEEAGQSSFTQAPIKAHVLGTHATTATFKYTVNRRTGLRTLTVVE